MTTPDALANDQRRKDLVLRLQHLGARTDEDQRHVCAVWTKGRARRRTELTERDAVSLLVRLQTMDALDLARILSMTVPGDEPEPPATPPPAPAVDPAACLASWDDVDPVAAPEEPEPEPVATVTEEPTPADTADELRPRPRDGDDLATVADHRPAAPAPLVTYEPPPVDIEQAAAAAVERFRARAAAGIVPTAPDLSSLPPRTVVRYTAPGRYCLPPRCYCGTCEGYAEQVADAERAHARILAGALRGDDDTGRRR